MFSSPGSTVGNTTKEECISLIAECINRAHRETNSVVTVIENMVSSMVVALVCVLNGISRLEQVISLVGISQT